MPKLLGELSLPRIAPWISSELLVLLDVQGQWWEANQLSLTPLGLTK